MKPRCEVRCKLAAEFATAARLHSETVVDLVLSNISHHDYVRLSRKTELTKDQSEAAFIAFKAHMEWHRCYDTEVSDARGGDKEVNDRSGKAEFNQFRKLA